jgi:plasmid stabilization system protein ParE
MRIAYLTGALSDLESVRTFIARDNPEAAARVIARIEQAANRLTEFPYSGRPGPRGARLLSVPGLPYVMIHRIHGDVVKIVAVFHTSRNRRFR